MKQMVILILIVFFALKIDAQSIDQKYLLALIHLKSDKKINKQIKLAFPKLFDKKTEYTDFQVSNKIEFIDIWYFEEQLKVNNYGIKPEFIENWMLYDSTYRFQTIYNESLGKLLPPSNSKLLLTFSKPIDNYLIAELIFNISPDYDHYKSQIKFGRAMQFLFIYDSDGLIEKVFYTAGTHN